MEYENVQKEGVAEDSQNVELNIKKEDMSEYDGIGRMLDEVSSAAEVAAHEEVGEVAADVCLNDHGEVDEVFDVADVETEAAENSEVEDAVATDAHKNVAKGAQLDETVLEVEEKPEDPIEDAFREAVGDLRLNDLSQEDIPLDAAGVEPEPDEKQEVEAVVTDTHNSEDNDGAHLDDMGLEIEDESDESIEDAVRETVADMLDAVVDVQDINNEQAAVLTADQIELLEDLFLNAPNPDRDILEAVAMSMAITLAQATEWFEQRKAAEANQNAAPGQVEDMGPPPNEFWQPHQQIGNEDDETELSWYQVMMMENLFESTHTPDAGLRAAVAASIGLSDTKVQAWFAHRRAISGISEPVQNNRTERVAIDRQYPQGVLEAFMELPEPDENYQIGQMADENQDKEFNEELKRRMSCEVCDTDNKKAFRCCKCMTGFCKKCHKGYIKHPTYVSPADDRLICEFCHHPQKEFQKIVVPRM